MTQAKEKTTGMYKALPFTYKVALRLLVLGIFLISFLTAQSIIFAGTIPLNDARHFPDADPPNRPSLVSGPSISLGVPAETFLGDPFSFSATFNNASADPGYGPFIDLVFPVNGADGAAGADTPDGIDFVSATYLGQSVTAVELPFPDDGGGSGCVDHPYAEDATHAPLQVCGVAGDKLVVLQLPFGSFTQDQPSAAVTVNANSSNLADLGTPLAIYARSGFQFGDDPLDNPCCDPSVVSTAITDTTSWPTAGSTTPILLEISKSYSGPEDETASGPNFPRQYTINVDLAPGQVVSNLVITDSLPDNMAFSSLVSVLPATGTVTVTPTVGSAANPPNNILQVEFSSVIGGSPIQVVFEYFIPQDDAGGSPVINVTNGDDVTSDNKAMTAGNWTPIDIRDSLSPTSAGGVCGACPPGHTLTAKSIAVQKGAAIVVDNFAAGASPGDVLEFAINFQISDYFSFASLVISDTFSDGMRYDAAFTPTLSVSDRNGVVSGTFTAGLNLTIDTSEIATDTNPATDGSTTLTFDVSQAMTDLGAIDGALEGGRATLPDAGPAVGTISFRAIIQEEFSDDYPSGDKSVDHGDNLNNSVTIQGDILNNGTLIAGGEIEKDGSGASVTIVDGGLEKSIYAVNGSTTFSNPVQVSPGYSVTYRLKYDLPTSNFEDLSFSDYLPLPIFSATTVTTFTALTSPVAPPVGQAWFGPDETFYPSNPPGSQIVPTVTTSITGNSVTFSYGDYDDPANSATVIDLLFSVEVSDDPFADGLFLTNVAQANEGSTNAGASSADAIIQIELLEPVLILKKGVLGSDNPNAVSSPPITAPATFPLIDSSDLVTNPVDSDISGIDAGDLVNFAVVIENQGHSGGFDLEISDSLVPGFIIPPGGINLEVVRGDGLPISYTLLGPTFTITATDFFSGGIQLIDPPGDGICQTVDGPPGANIVIISYDLMVDPTVEPPDVVPNTATLDNYAGSEGGPNHASDPANFQDSASTTVASPAINKTFNGTNQGHTTGADVAIGELVQYTVVISIPEGQSSSAFLTDTLDTGLAFYSLDAITASASLTTSVGGGFNRALIDAVISNTGGGAANNGNTVTFDFGTITNSDTDNNLAETITLTYSAVVINGGGNDRGDTRNNRALWTWSATADSVSASAPNVTIVEPELQIAKTASPGGGDAGDTITYDLTISHAGPSDADAFDLVFSDLIPADLTYLTASFTHTAGLTPTLIDDSGRPTLTATWATFTQGTTSTLQFQVVISETANPGQTITNTAGVSYTGLPGDVTTPLTTSNSLSGERTGDTGDPGGADNDYTTTGFAPLIIDTPGLTKSITATSEIHTGFVGGGERVAVGEIVRYRLVVQLPEGTSPDFQIWDRLPNNLLFLDDNTAMAALVANGAGITSTTLITASISCDGGANPDLNFSGNSSAGFTPKCPLPAAAVSNSPTVDNDTYNSGSDVYFKFGDLHNADDDAGPEFVIGEFNALVMNTTANVSGATRNNRFRVLINGAESADSNVAGVTIAEPVISMTKTLNTVAIDAGDTISYTIVYTNIAAGNNAADAFDILLTDTLDSNLIFGSHSIAAPGGAAVTDTTSAPTVSFAVDRLAPGEWVTVTITATVASIVLGGGSIDNTADLVYTGLPGPGGSGTNPTGSTTPGAPGDQNGERNGSGGVGGSPNDYAAGHTASFIIDSANPVKNLAGTSATHTGGTDVAIGEVLTYSLAIPLPESIISSLVITDNLPGGLAFVPGSVTTDTTGFNGSFTPGDPSIVSSGGSGDDVIITYSNPLTVTADNDLDNNTFTVTLRAVVVDEPGNVGLPPGQIDLTNVVTTQVGSSIKPSNPVTTTVVEPQMVITKTITPLEAAANDTVTISLVAQNTGPTAAFDLIIEDRLPGDTFTNFSDLSSTPGFTFSTIPAGPNTIVRYTGGDLGAGQTIALTFTAQVTGYVAGGITVTNVATVTQATTLPGPDPNERDEPDVGDSDTLTLVALSLGNLVWVDSNNNGQVDGGESGVPNVVVNLLDSGGSPLIHPLTGQPITTTTDGGGYYTFTNLISGTYIVEIEDTNFLPSGPLENHISSTPTDTNTDNDQNNDDNGLDDANPAGNGIQSSPVTLTIGDEPVTDGDIDDDSNLTVDFGFFEPLTLGNLVWLDNGIGGGASDDGQVNGSETGIPGVTVTLVFSGTTTPIMTTTTDVGGFYTFTYLFPNDYQVLIPADNFQSGGPLDAHVSSSGENDPETNTDNDDNGPDPAGPADYPADGVTGNPVTLDYDTEPDTPIDGDNTNGNLTVDFGFLTYDWGDLPDSYNTTVGNSGANHVIDGITFLGAGVDAEWDGQPSVNAGGDDVNPITVDDEDGITFLTPLMPGQSAAIQIVAGSAGYLNAWIDFDGNGIFDAGEQVFSDTNFVAPGSYTYTIAVPTVVSDTIYSRFRFTSGGGEATTSAGPAPNGEVEDYVLMSLGNTVWLDEGPGTTNNGQLDGGESGISGVVLELYTAIQTPGLDTPIATTATITGGDYRFTGLEPGDYIVHIPAAEFGSGEPLENLASSTGSGLPNADMDEDADENGIDDANSSSNGISSGSVTLALGSEPVSEDGNANSNLTIDFGFYEPLSLGNLVWLDDGAGGGSADDGLVNGSEAGISGVTLTLVLSGATTPIMTTTTGASGTYLFDDLAPGDYQVIIHPDNFLPGGPLEDYLSSSGSNDPNTDVDNDDNGLNPTTPAGYPTTGVAADPVTLDYHTEPLGEDGNDNTNLTIDFGLYPEAGIGDTVWLDDDRDGIQDSGEVGVPGVTVILNDDTNTPIMTTTTGVSGSYIFSDLPPGDYSIKVLPPLSYTISPQDRGAGDAADSDIDPDTGQTITTTLDPGEYDPTWDAGIFPVDPSIAIDKRINIARIAPNQVPVVTYTLAVTNNGNIPLAAITVTDTLDNGLTFAPGSATLTPTGVVGQVLIWVDLTGGVDLMPGDSLQIAFEATVTTTIGTYINNGLSEAIYDPGINYPGSSVSDEDEAPIQVADPAVSLAKQVVPPGAVDGVITFTIAITNTGPSVIDILPLVDTFSGPISYTGGIPSADADLIDNLNGTLGWRDLTTHFGNLQPGQIVTVATVFQIMDSSAEFSMTNRAAVSRVQDTQGNPANDEEDTVTLTNFPSAVDLLSFQAGRRAQHVLVTWETAVEYDNFGFRLLRNTSDNLVEATEIAFIPGQGHGAHGGAAYSLLDETAQANQTYHYWLVDVDFNAVETAHGPVSISTVDTTGGGEFMLYLPLIAK